MRDKVTGVGKEIEKMMLEKGISIEELSSRAGISKSLLIEFFRLEKEPYIIPEMNDILEAMEIPKDQKLALFQKWQTLLKQKQKNKEL